MDGFVSAEFCQCRSGIDPDLLAAVAAIFRQKFSRGDRLFSKCSQQIAADIPYLPISAAGKFGEPIECSGRYLLRGKFTVCKLSQRIKCFFVAAGGLCQKLPDKCGLTYFA